MPLYSIHRFREGLAPSRENYDVFDAPVPFLGTQRRIRRIPASALNLLASHRAKISSAFADELLKISQFRVHDELALYRSLLSAMLGNTSRASHTPLLEAEIDQRIMGRPSVSPDYAQAIQQRAASLHLRDSHLRASLDAMRQSSTRTIG